MSISGFRSGSLVDQNRTSPHVPPSLSSRRISDLADSVSPFQLLITSVISTLIVSTTPPTTLAPTLPAVSTTVARTGDLGPTSVASALGTIRRVSPGGATTG